jgi:hypothetical protein
MNSAESGLPRRSIYALFITLAVAAACGRIFSVQRIYEPQLSKPANQTAANPDADAPDSEDLDPDDPRGVWPKDRPRPMPTHGANDRSRWATIRALVEESTYVIGHQDIGPAPSEYKDRGIVAKDGWGTIDKVRDPETHDFYSSKPPLLPTLLAGECWILKKFGLSIVDDRWIVMRVVLLTVNALPWLFYLLFLARLVECFGTTDWGRIFVMAAACFGTLITPFLNTLNNHTIAACFVLFALYPVMMSFRSPLTCMQALAAGFFAGFAACNELPASSFLAVAFGLLLWREPRRTLLYFLPAALIPIGAFFLTNYLAIHQWRPAYGEFGGASGWYEYPGSHWNPDNKIGIDWASTKENVRVYAFHLLVGHHGLFSLTPMFFLAVAGFVVGILHLSRRKGSPQSTHSDGDVLPIVAGSTLLLSVVVIGFYVFGVGARSRNYGGWTCGPRWLLWLTPLYLLTMLPVCDWLAARRWGRGLCYVLLAISVVSVSYPAWSPWRHPWLYNLIDALGGIPYNHPSPS